MDPALPAGVGAVPGPVRAGAPGRPARTGHRTADLGPPEAHRHHAHAGGRGHRLHAVDPASRAAPAHRLPVPVLRGRGRNAAGRPSAGGLHADSVRGHHLAAGRGAAAILAAPVPLDAARARWPHRRERARDAEHGRARHPHRGRAHRRTVRPAQHSGRGAVQHSRQPDLAAEPLCHRRADLGAELAALVLRHTRLPRAGADHGRAGPGRLPERRHQRRRLRRRVRAEQQPDGRVHLHRRRRRDTVAGGLHPVVLAYGIAAHAGRRQRPGLAAERERDSAVRPAADPQPPAADPFHAGAGLQHADRAGGGAAGLAAAGSRDTAADLSRAGQRLPEHRRSPGRHRAATGTAGAGRMPVHALRAGAGAPAAGRRHRVFQIAGHHLPAPAGRIAALRARSADQHLRGPRAPQRRDHPHPRYQRV